MSYSRMFNHQGLHKQAVPRDTEVLRQFDYDNKFVLDNISNRDPESQALKQVIMNHKRSLIKQCYEGAPKHQTSAQVTDRSRKNTAPSSVSKTVQQHTQKRGSIRQRKVVDSDSGSEDSDSSNESSEDDDSSSASSGTDSDTNDESGTDASESDDDSSSTDSDTDSSNVEDEATDSDNTSNRRTRKQARKSVRSRSPQVNSSDSDTASGSDESDDDDSTSDVESDDSATKDSIEAEYNMLMRNVKRFINKFNLTEVIDSAQYGTPILLPDNIGRRNRQSDVSFSKVKYNNNKYAVIKIHLEANPVFTVIDLKYLKYALSYSIGATPDNPYVNMVTNTSQLGMRYRTTLHEFILLLCKRAPLSRKESVDHINVVTYDNREVNLRPASETLQQLNKNRDSRNVTIANGTMVTLPPFIQYMTTHGKHNDRLEIHLKCIKHAKIFDTTIVNGSYRWKGTSNKNVGFNFKLKEALKQLDRIAAAYTDLGTLRGDSVTAEAKNTLRREFNEILKLSGFPPREIKTMLVLSLNIATGDDIQLDDSDNDDFDEMETLRQYGRKRVKSLLPTECKFNESAIPKYCSYYRANHLGRSDRFVIDRHPTLMRAGKRNLAFGSGESTDAKFALMMKAMRDLDNGIIPKVARGRGKVSSIVLEKALPEGITIDMMPPKCCWKMPSGRTGGYFYIDHHDAVRHKQRTVLSVTSAKVSNKKKYREMISRYNELEAQINRAPFKIKKS